MLLQRLRSVFREQGENLDFDQALLIEPRNPLMELSRCCEA